MFTQRHIAVIIFLLAAGILAAPGNAMINPSAGYCTALGYQYGDTVAAEGSMAGYCLLPNNQSVDAWKFLQGVASPEMSYCRKQGLEVRTVNDSAICGMLGSTCAVCVKADGSIEEVTRMMGLGFREKICNDKICCDPAVDTICAIGAEAPNAGMADWFLIILIAVIAVSIIAVAVVLMRRKNKGSKTEQKDP
jgi:putative hemolysin